MTPARSSGTPMRAARAPMCRSDRFPEVCVIARDQLIGATARLPPVHRLERRRLGVDRHPPSVSIPEPGVPSAPVLVFGGTFYFYPGFDQSPRHLVHVVHLDGDFHRVGGSGIPLLHSNMEALASTYPEVSGLLGEDREAEDVNKQAALPHKVGNQHENVAELGTHTRVPSTGSSLP
jgi:hypothetical protein